MATDERIEMLKAFDETKAGVKGLLDLGITEIPQIFVRPPEELAHELTCNPAAQLQIPLIDLTHVHNPQRRKQIVEQIRIASTTWGFFQVVNHGIPLDVVDAMIDGITRFNEADDVEEKKKYYSRDPTRRVRFMTNHDLFSSRSANWRDTLTISWSNQLSAEDLPPSCGESTMKYSKHVAVLGITLVQLFAEGLGVEADRLHEMDCSKGNRISCHYYPPCPQPHLTLGTTTHSDIGFITLLLQNHISGLQVLHQNGWVEVEPIHGALVVNIGDLLQLVSNGKFVSSKHRVVANKIGPRISVACFFGSHDDSKSYGPITELITKENPAIYRDITMAEYLQKFLTTGLDEYLGLDYYKL